METEELGARQATLALQEILALLVQAVRVAQVAMQVILVGRAVLEILVAMVTAAAVALEETAVEAVMVVRQVITLKLLRLAEILVAQTETGRALVTAGLVVLVFSKRMEMAMLAEAALEAAVVVVTTVAAAQAVTQVQTETLALQAIMAVVITMVVLERLVMTELTDNKGQTAQALQQETQATMETQV